MVIESGRPHVASGSKNFMCLDLVTRHKSLEGSASHVIICSRVSEVKKIVAISEISGRSALRLGLRPPNESESKDGHDTVF
jgi:hypothetical protein